MIDRWKIRLLGPLVATLGEHSVTRFRTQQTAALLAYMAFHVGKTHSREGLIELMWSDGDVDSGRHNLSNALSSLRNQFEPPGVRRGTVLIADRFTVRLNPAAVVTDVGEFDAAIRSIRSVEEPSLDQLMAIVDSYTAPLLPHQYSDWILPHRARLDEEFRQCADKLIGVLVRDGEYERALHYARCVHALDPLHDGANLQLLRLLASCNRSSEALSHYTALDGLQAYEPSGAVRRLANRIRADAVAAEETQGVPVPIAPTPIRGNIPRPALDTVTFLAASVKPAVDATNDPRQATPTWASLLCAECRRLGGAQVRNTGKAFVFSYDSAVEAVAALGAFRRALVAQPWPNGQPAVAAAIHTGDCEPAECGGAVLNRTLGLLAAAHGAQSLASESTAALVRGAPTVSTRFRDLGQWRTRGQNEPIRIYQVDAEGEPPIQFPRINADAVRSVRLPLHLTRFIGRKSEIDAIVTHLRSPDMRLLTLIGPGGAGKTRLAVEAAAAFGKEFGGSIYYVHLADVTEQALTAGAVIDSIGVPRSPHMSAYDQAVALLSKERTLLVLDNVEHLLDAQHGPESIDRFVRIVLERVSTLTIMATSRKLLRLPGEHKFTVAPLPTPKGVNTPELLTLCDSVRLFIDRAQVARADFQITEGNAQAIAELCDRLEGIPLAIELAAARALVISPAQMLDQLTNRFALLSTRQRGVVERHRTLRSSISWSFRLLSTDCQHSFSRLSVFRGGWTLDAAAFLFDDGQALERLETLRECSLIIAEETTNGMRFRMLETIREFAYECLTELHEVRTCAARHAQYFLQLAKRANEQLRGPQQNDWLEQLEAEHDNCREAIVRSLDKNEETTAEGSRSQTAGVALQLCRQLMRFWWTHGHLVEGREWCERALRSETSDKYQVERAWTFSCAGILAYGLGDSIAARAYQQRCLDIARPLGETKCIANAVISLGREALRQGDVEYARTCLEEGLAVYRCAGNATGVADALSQLAWLYHLLGDTESPLALQQESLAIYSEAGDTYNMGRLLDDIGAVYRARGDYSGARAYHERSLALQQQIANRRGIAITLHNLAIVSDLEGDRRAACEHLLSSVAILRDLGDRVGIAAALEAAASFGADSNGNPAGMDANTAPQGACKAVALLGAADRIRQETRTPVPASDRQRYDQVVSQVRAALGPGPFRTAWEAGRRMSPEEAADLAMEAPREL